MRSIEDIIYEEYSNTRVSSDKKYVLLQRALSGAEAEMMAVLDADQQKLFRKYQDASDALEVYNDMRTIKFVLGIVRQFFNPTKKLDSE